MLPFQMKYLTPVRNLLKHKNVLSNVSPRLFSDKKEATISFDTAVASNSKKVSGLENVNKNNVEIVNRIRPTIKSSFNLAAYVNSSVTLQELLKLEIDLSIIDKYTDLASYLVKADYEKDIKPYINLLKNYGISDQDLGRTLNRNVFFLTIPIKEIEARIEYFKFRKFTKTQIATILTKALNIFSFDAKVIDSRISNLMNEYKLTATEMRHVILRYPRIIHFTPIQIRTSTFVLNEQMGFSHEEIKSILLKNCVLWKPLAHGNGDEMVKTFNFLHNEMKITHQQLINDPRILGTRAKIITPRHEYLSKLNRAQYDPTKPLYVPLNAFYQCNDKDFCLDYAKTSVDDYYQFLKTI